MTRRDFFFFFFVSCKPLEKSMNKTVPVQVGVWTSSRWVRALYCSLWTWCINWMGSKLCLRRDLACCHPGVFVPGHLGWPRCFSHHYQHPLQSRWQVCAGRPPWSGWHTNKPVGMMLYGPSDLPQFPDPLSTCCMLLRDVQVQVADRTFEWWAAV